MVKKNMEEREFNELLKKALPKEFVKMKETIGKKNYDTLNIISGTLLSDAVIFMKKIGVLEEFLENKNEISHMLINSILENREKERC